MSSRPRTTSNINSFQCSQRGGCSFISLSEAIARWNIFTTVCSVWGINGSFGHYLFSAALVEICCWRKFHTFCKKYLLVVDDLMSGLRLITDLCFNSVLRELLEWKWHSGIHWKPHALVINSLIKKESELFHSAHWAQYCTSCFMLLHYWIKFFDPIWHLKSLLRLISPEYHILDHSVDI